MKIAYKGYVAKLQFSPYTNSFFGEVINSQDLIAFHISHPTEALEALQTTVERYLLHIEMNQAKCIL